MESAFEVFQKSLEAAICDALVKTNQTLQNSITLRKKVRDLSQGDIVVPAGCLKLNSSEHDKLIVLMKEYCDRTETMTTRVSCDKYNMLSFFIDRPMMCGLVVKEVLARGSRYGCMESQQDQVLSLHTVSSKNTTSLMDLRLAIVQFHTVKLLQANGYTVKPAVQPKTSEYEQIVQKFSEHSSVEDKTSQAASASESLTSVDPESFSFARQRVLSKLCSLDANRDANKSKTPGDSESFRQSVDAEQRTTSQDILKSEKEGNVFIDLQNVISSHNLHIGKGGFGANLKDVQVLQDHQPTEVLKETMKIIHSVSDSSPTTKHHCLHVIPHNAAFYDQQIVLTVQILRDSDLTQSQTVVGPVNIQDTSQASPLSAEDFYKSRLSQFKEASEMRSAISSDGCSEDDVKTLTDASIKIDVLGNACHSPLTLENSASGCGAESRLGAFILYNTARLSTLLQRFEQAVAEGIYPALPSVDSIDWGLLREEEDWELVYVYLAAFPEVVSQSVECIVPADRKLSAKIHTHKVTNFLVTFCKCLSAHYSRYHILTGRESHLLPLMYARLYMMKAAHQVLLNSLDLLGIQSLSYV